MIPMVKVFSVLGWVLFVLEMVLVLSYFFQRNVGGDAGGKGMATAIGMVLLPLLLAAGGLMLWGQRSGPKAAYWAGLMAISLPLLLVGRNLYSSAVQRFVHARYTSLPGEFDKPDLTRMARAIDRGDAVQLRELLAKGSIDFEARDRMGRTLLGHAIFRVMEGDSRAASLDQIRLLLEAGARPAENSLAAGATPQYADAHLLLINVVGSNNLPLLELLLGAGLNPNGVDMDGRPVIFTAGITVKALEILATHGADLNARDVRTDRPGWSTLMNAAYLSAWDPALFLLDHGVSPEYVAPDHQTVRSILKDREQYYGKNQPAEYDTLRKRLQLK